MSGPPLPAATAFCTAVYCLSPVPALTRFTLTFGYCCWNAATTCLRVGSQAHTVMLPPLVSAAWTSASETLPPPAAPVDDEEDGDDEPQPATPSSAARAAAVAPRNTRRGCLVMLSSHNVRGLIRRSRTVVHSLPMPAESPACQNRWSSRNATTSGRMVSSEPVMTRL